MKKWIPRTLAYGFVGLLIVVCLAKIEAWPLTSVHLFSSVRTSDSVALELIAIDSDEARVRVNPGEGEVMSRTTHLYSKLPSQEPHRQVEMVQAWLDAAGITDVERVQLERVTRQMGETSADWAEVDREIIWELIL